MNKTDICNLNTPCYIFDIEAFHDQVKKVKDAWGDIPLCFSIKANPFLAGKTPAEIDWLEVCSPGELEICKKKNVNPEKIIFSGVNKTAESVKEAIELKAGIFTAESIRQADLIEDAANGSSVKVILRLSAGSQFGMSEEDFIQILDDKKTGKYKNLDIIGLHFFSGTQKKKVKDIEKELNYLRDFIEKLKLEKDFSMSHIEYGTGLGVEYFSAEGNEKDDTLLSDTGELLKEFAKDYPLTVEMGRFFAASCGDYVTKVVDLKSTHDINYCICDGGINQLKYQGQIMGMQTPEIEVIKTQHEHQSAEMPNGSVDLQNEQEKYCICGSLCTTSDVLVRSAELCKLEIEDKLIFKKVGAYSVTEGLAMFLSRELPAIYYWQVNQKTQEKTFEQVRGIIETYTFNS